MYVLVSFGWSCALRLTRLSGHLHDNHCNRTTLLSTVGRGAWVSVLGRVVWFLNTLLFFLPSVCGIFSFKKKRGGGGGWWDGFVCNVKYYAPNLVTGFRLWCFPVILHMYEF